MFLKLSLFYLFLSSLLSVSEARLDLKPYTTTFDPAFYEQFLDTEVCQEQLQYISNNALLKLEFLDAGLRIPRGILKGNTFDLGNYYQCLEIREETENLDIEGKYCALSLKINENNLNILRSSELLNSPEVDYLFEDEIQGKVKWVWANKTEDIQSLIERRVVRNDMRSDLPAALTTASFRLAACIPKTCTLNEGINGLYFNLSNVGLEYEELTCRLPNDKLWRPIDYVTTSILSFIGLLCLLSTAYDVKQHVIDKNDPKTSNGLYMTFSIYTNTRQFVTFKPSRNNIESLDGIRALGMMWIILGHAFSTIDAAGLVINRVEMAVWRGAPEAIWVAAANISVDSFFVMGGLLLVYTTVGKVSGKKLISNLGMFYFNRYMRVTPLLAVAVMLQGSLVFRAADGPYWDVMTQYANQCRTYWWSALLYTQNYLNPLERCLGQSWYLAIDMQMYILSPIVLFWVLNGTIGAWISLIASWIFFSVVGTIYLFDVRYNEDYSYHRDYYFNTICRAPVYIMGMMIGYILVKLKNKKLGISKLNLTLLWVSFFIMSIAVCYSFSPINQPVVNNLLAEIIIRILHRPAWALCMGWLIIACEHGYGGPINWLLRLQVWKLISRISYGLYLFHYPLMYMVASSSTQTLYFFVGMGLYKYLADFCLAFLVSFVASVTIDLPIASLVKRYIGKGSKKPKPIPVAEGSKDDKTTKSTTTDGAATKDKTDIKPDMIVQTEIMDNSATKDIVKDDIEKAVEIDSKSDDNTQNNITRNVVTNSNDIILQYIPEKPGSKSADEGIQENITNGIDNNTANKNISHDITNETVKKSNDNENDIEDKSV